MAADARELIESCNHAQPSPVIPERVSTRRRIAKFFSLDALDAYARTG
jgi:hypothetical protein